MGRLGPQYWLWTPLYLLLVPAVRHMGTWLVAPRPAPLGLLSFALALALPKGAVRLLGAPAFGLMGAWLCAPWLVPLELHAFGLAPALA